MCWVVSVYYLGIGWQLEVFMDEFGIQFYSGNFLDGMLLMFGGGIYGYCIGFCLEIQYYLDLFN